MLYMGFFSFDGLKDKPFHGYITCAVHADDVDASMDSFQHLLKVMRKEDDALAGVANIYLDTIVEVKMAPEEAFLAHMVSREGELGTSISTVLPHVDNHVAQAFTTAPTETEDEAVEMEPFVSF